MIINGSIYITNDPNIVLNGMNSNMVLLTMEEEGSIFNLNANNIIKSTILLPPPDATIAMINGDAELSTNLYYNYLRNPHVREFIDMMLVVLYKGNSILLFSPQTDFSDVYNGLLCNFLLINYGLSVGNGSVPFQFDPNYTCFIDSCLYLAGFLSVNEFAKEYFDNTQIDPAVISKLIMETGIRIPEAENAVSMEQFNVIYNDYFMKYIHELKTKVAPVHFIANEE